MAGAHDTRVPDILGTLVPEIVLSIAFVAMRLQARRISFGYLKLDLSDWLAVSALVFALTFFIVVAVSTRYGLGRHMKYVTTLRDLTILHLLANTLHTLAIGSLKLSILALYRSLLPSQSFRYALVALSTIAIGWTITTVVLGIAFCIPLDSLWSSATPPTRCYPVNLIGLITTVIHVAIEIAIFLSPIPCVLKLQASKQRKHLILLAFIVGGLSCLVSVARIPVWTETRARDTSWQQVPTGLLAATELTVGILAISFPTYGPLLKSYRADDGNLAIKEGNYSDTRQPTLGSSQHEVTVSVGGGHSTSHMGIMVTDEIELMRHSNGGGGWTEVADEDE